MVADALSAAGVSGPRATTARGNYGLIVAGAMLALVLVGFGPTFFLRFGFDVKPISPGAYAHGVVLTAWFATLVSQSWLIRNGHRRLHRSFGWWAAGLAVLVVIVAGAAAAISVHRDGEPSEPLAAIIQQVIFSSNLMHLMVFTVLVGAALILRRDRDTHARLMLLGSSTFVGVATARIARWPIFLATPAPLDAIAPLERHFMMGGIVAIVLLMVVLDLLTRRRLHVATFIGGAVVLASRFLVVPFVGSAAARGIYQSLLP